MDRDLNTASDFKRSEVNFNTMNSPNEVTDVLMFNDKVQMVRP